MGRKSQCSDRHEELVLLNQQGLTRNEIAIRMQLSPKAIGIYLRRRGIPAVRHKGKAYLFEPQELSAMIASGLTLAAIADKKGCSVSAVERSAARMKLETARTGPRSGSGHRDWRGGCSLDRFGYIEIYAPLHPFARKSGAVSYTHLTLPTKRIV